MSTRKLIWDTHAHLNDEKFDPDREQVIQRAGEAGVETIVNVGYSEASSLEAVKIAEAYNGMYATVGIHPHDVKDCTANTWETLARLAKNPRVVAWGEIGLDYYRDLSPREVQRKAFIQQLEMADSAGLPVVIHNREAHADTLQIVKKYRPAAGGVFHSYSGSWEMARELLALGFYLSFSGPVTYKNARQTLEIAAKVPEDRFLVETDCPYLTPEPNRGKRNEPAYVTAVLAKLAEIRGISIEEAACLSGENAQRIFKAAN